MYIELNDVSVKYQQDVMAVSDISFTIDRGEFVFLAGHTGAGKSTIVQLLARNILPSAGTVRVGGLDVTKLRGGALRKYRKRLGWMPQDPTFLPHRTVFENVALPLEFCGASRSAIIRSVSRTLEQVGIDHLADRFPLQLSGGEKQRACLARALVTQPNLLLADEPTGHVDAQTAQKLFQELNNACATGTTVLMVTHDPALIGAMNHRVLFMRQGRIVPGEREGEVAHDA